MTMEKTRLINELITNFLGHSPTQEEKKQFHILNLLDESIVYYRGDLIGTVKHDGDDGLVI